MSLFDRGKTVWLLGCLLTLLLSVFIIYFLKPDLLKKSIIVFGNFNDLDSVQINGDTYAADVELLAVYGNPSSLEGKGGSQVVVSDDGALTVSGFIAKDKSKEQIRKAGGRDEIRVYTVREGDSLSEIADMFSISVNTLRWSNDLASDRQIKPGQDLIILPINGIVHTIRKGDTLGAIANKYKVKAADIITFNHLNVATGLTVGKDLIIPNAVVSQNVIVKREKPVKSTIGFINPAPGSIRTQGIHGHNAVDLANDLNSPIKAVAAGKVIVSRTYGWNGGYGKYVVIRHKTGVQTLYAHLNKNYVSVGDWVSAGQVIGLMGSTGRSTGPHLHFEVRGGKNPF